MSELIEKNEQAVLPSAPTHNDLVAIAISQGASLDTIEKLMELQERHEANEAKKAYVRAMNAFKADPPEIVNDQAVCYPTSKGTTQYNHASLQNVTDKIAEALAPHSLSHRWDIEQLDGGQIRVTCVITHELGHSESTSLQAGPDQSGGKNNIQAVGSTVKYLQRYTLLAATGLATKEMDDDGRGSEIEYITEDEALAIHAKITDNDIDLEKFLAWLKKSLGADSIDHIAKSALPDVLRMIDTTIKRKAKK